MSSLPLQKILQEYQELNEQMAGISDPKQIMELGKKQKTLSQKAELASQVVSLENIIKSNQELLESGDADSEMVEMLQIENNESKESVEKLEKELLSLLAPSDPRDEKDIYIEIRAGAGGDESSIFAADLFKMYSGMCQRLNLKINPVSLSENTLGGYKEIVAEIKGENAYALFKYEGGVHRVQRVPATEKQGRVHTSTASVAIMPILPDNEFKLDMNEVEIIASTSQGAGGQSVNTTYSAIQVVHKPTGIRAQCQDERKQAANKERALNMLASRVFDHYEEERLSKERQERKDQVGKADRSEKIRTYNYPQDRVTDHRYSLSYNNLPDIMTGGIIDMINEIKEIEGRDAIAKLS